MRRLRGSGLVGTLLVLTLLVAAVTVGCGAAAQNIGQAHATPTTPQGILEQALLNMSQVISGTGNVNVDLGVTGDQSKMPAGAQALLGQPIRLSGTYSFDKNARAAQTTLSAAIGGQNLLVSLEAVNGQAWLQFRGQWYQTPARTEKAGETTSTDQESLAFSLEQAFTAAGIDPSTWLTGVDLLGDEKINGVDTLHISATLNVSHIASDLSTLAQSGALKTVIPRGAAEATESTTEGSLTSETMPAQQELQQLKSNLVSTVQNLTLDVWVTKDGYEIRQMELRATINPASERAQSQTTTSTGPATTEAPAQATTPAALESLVRGIKSLSLDATVSFAPATSPVKVAPPSAAKPWSDFQTAMQGLTSMFSGVPGEGSTSTSAR